MISRNLNRHTTALAVFVIAGLVLLAANLGASDPIPGAPQSAPVAIVGATVHPIDGAPIDGATIVFNEGIIVAIGRGVAVPSGAEMIDATGKHVYPGLIASATSLGLVEIGAVGVTDDQREMGDLNPNVRAAIAVNPDSEHIPVARANGIALAASRPGGGLISGHSVLLRLDGWSWEDLAVDDSLGIEIQWPSLGGGRRRYMEGEDQHHIHDGAGNDEGPMADEPPDRTAERNAGRAKRVEQIKEIFEQARIYCKNRSADSAIKDGIAPDLRLEGLRPAIEGSCPVFLHAQGAREIRESVEWAIGAGLRPVIIGGRDAPRIASFLAERKVPVVYGPVHRVPSNRGDAYDEPFTGPARLAEAGVEFSIGSFDTSNMRNLPYHAATAAAFGLSPEKALESITIAPARIFGVADRYGSLVRGKSATMIITDGDPLEIMTNVEAMWIDGRRVDLTSRHTQLRDKYAEKIRRSAVRRTF